MFETRSSKKKLLGLAYALELGMTCEDVEEDFVLHAAEKLKSALRANLSLTEAEKIRIVKLMSRAKARAYAQGPADDYKTYRALNTIGNDLLRLL